MTDDVVAPPGHEVKPKAALAPWKPGSSGKGVQAIRRSYTSDYFAALQAAFAEYGAEAMAICAKEEPKAFLDICSRHIPRDVTIALEHHHEGGLDHTAVEILKAIQQSIPGANDREPGEVLTLVLEAVRIHMAKPVTSSE